MKKARAEQIDAIPNNSPIPAKEHRALAAIGSFVAIFTRLATYPYTLKHLDELVGCERKEGDDLSFRLVRFLCAPLKSIAELYHQKFDFKFILDYLNQDICKSELDIIDKLPLVDSFYDLDRTQRIQFLLTLSSIQSEINQHFPALVRDNCVPDYLRLEHYGPSVKHKVYWFIIDYRGHFRLYEEDVELTDRAQPSEASTCLVAESRKELELFIGHLKEDLATHQQKLQKSLSIHSLCTFCSQSTNKDSTSSNSAVKLCDECGFSSHEECIIRFFGQIIQTEPKIKGSPDESQNSNESLSHIPKKRGRKKKNDSNSEPEPQSLESAEDSNPEKIEQNTCEEENEPEISQCCLMCVHQSMINDFEILKDWLGSRKVEAAHEDALEAKRRKRNKLQMERARAKHKNDLERYHKELEEFEEKKHKLNNKTVAILKNSLDTLYASIQQSKIANNVLSDTANILKNTEYNELNFVSDTEEEMYSTERANYTDNKENIDEEFEALEELEGNNQPHYDCTTDASDYSSSEGDEYDENADAAMQQCSPEEPSAGSVSDLNTNSLIDNFTSSLQINSSHQNRLKSSASEEIIVKKPKKAICISPMKDPAMMKKKRGRPKGSSKKLQMDDGGKKLKHSHHKSNAPDAHSSKHSKPLLGEIQQNGKNKVNIASSYPGPLNGHKLGPQMRKIVRNFKYNPLAAFEADNDQNGDSSPAPAYSPDMYHPQLGMMDDNECNQNTSLLIFNDTFVDPDEVECKMMDKYDMDKLTATINESVERIANEAAAKKSPEKASPESKVIPVKNQSKKRMLNDVDRNSFDGPPHKRSAMQIVESDDSEEECGETHAVKDFTGKKLDKNEAETVASTITDSRLPTSDQPAPSKIIDDQTTASTSMGPPQRVRSFTFLSNDDTSEEEMSEEEIKNIVDSLFDTGAADLLINNENRDDAHVGENLNEQDGGNGLQTEECDKNVTSDEKISASMRDSHIELPEFDFTELLQSLV